MDSTHSPAGEAPELENIESEPQAAAEIFGDRIELARRFAGHLATTGVEWGLLGPRELPRLWSRHILNCAVMAELLDDSDVVGDIGSGAGLPGIALAIARPNTRFVLVEAMERRVEWLQMVVDDLDLDNVRIVRSRVEELVDEEIFTVATARAVKSLPMLIEWCTPVLGPDGRLLAIKGQSYEAEIKKAAKHIKRYRLSQPKVHTLGTEFLEVPTTVLELRRR